ncbi:unnamed protein product [Heterobilharzia americana]|nr:unnamed protein product [Heterobilharzia americana]
MLEIQHKTRLFLSMEFIFRLQVISDKTKWCTTFRSVMVYSVHESPLNIRIGDNLRDKVDIFGKCGSKLCPRSSEKLCFKLLREEYKFYLSFENSLCKYYVTEKFYLNALQNDVIPIVMGASIEEYQSLAPPYSFIHVDQFESPFKLAEYLKYLDGNDTAYNEYFAWREHGEVKNWHGDPHCEICLLAHTVQYLHPSWVSDVSSWWNDACKDRRLRWDPSTFHSD